MNSRPPHAWIQTFTGRQFWPLSPHPDDIDIRDIAHALAMKCRFSGHSKAFYSVAQHSVLASDIVPTADARWALMHDASEAYLPDVARPIKGDLTGFKEIEERVMKCVAVRFDLSWPMPELIKAADLKLLQTEKRDLMQPSMVPWHSYDGGEPLIDLIIPWDWDLAERTFLARFAELFGEGGQ